MTAKGDHPDTLIMTATPIPRTLALTAYGNLEISIIDQLPPGRKPVKTKYLPYKARVQAYRYVKQEIMAGRQAYIAVSYTHLDVYKRQGNIFPKIPMIIEVKSGISFARA